MKFLVKLSLFLLLFVAGLIAIGIYWTFYSTIPDYDTTHITSGIESPAEVHWDPYGTPYIFASNEADLFYITGYIHAQERIWQMTLFQLAAEGRFAEFLGKELVSLDIHQRTLGFWETAKAIEQETTPEILSILESYSRGVNDFVANNRRSLPVEFSLLNIPPIEWTPTHSIAITRLMAWDQNIHWFSELSYGMLAETLDPAQLDRFLPFSAEDTAPESENGTASSYSDLPAEELFTFMERESTFRSLMQKRGFPFGSNAWAVNGRKTENGRPILAGDPHMGLSIPGYWYELSLNAPGISISGATIPGMPFVVMGQNQQLAWSITNMMADDTDFFLEQTASADPGSYVADSLQVPTTLAPYEKRAELIRVKDGDDVVHEVYSTERGPLISHIHPGQDLIGARNISMGWTGHQVSHEMEAAYRMNKAETMDEFMEGVSGFKSPVMNFIYADADDNIALFAAGSLPRRDYNPIIFRPGWNPEYAWGESLLFHEMPHQINPESGYVANANNKNHADDYPHYLGSFWEPESRILRIRSLLEIEDSLNAQFMQNMQLDVYSEHAREMVEILLPILRNAGPEYQLENAVTYLQNWDMDYSPGSTAASIYDLFLLKFSEKILTEEMGPELYHAFRELHHLPVLYIEEYISEMSVLPDESFILNDVSFRQKIRESMQETLQELEEKFGPETYEWRWENLQSLTLYPPLLGEAAMAPNAPYILRLIVNNIFRKGPFSIGGNGLTLNKSQYRWEKPFEVELGASIRRIIDFSEPGRSMSVLPTGQSGNPLSANYGDQTDLWLDGRYRYIYNDDTFFQQTSYQTTRFVPENLGVSHVN